MSLTTITALPQLPPRTPESHKGDFGRVLIVAGSRGMSGAAALAAKGALRGGAGLVRLAIPREVQPVVAAAEICCTTIGLSQDDHGHLAPAALGTIMENVELNDVLALGPGLGTSHLLTNLVAEVVRDVTIPLVLDADGLNALIGQPEALSRHGGPLILTPHPGEFGRLLGKTSAEVQADRHNLAATFAQEHRAVMVLKGHGTLVTDGVRLYENTTGNPGMASGGSGDVLTGLIAALVGQKLPVFEAAQLGVYLHGLAGDLAAAELGEISMIATDVVNHLPHAWAVYRRELTAKRKTNRTKK